MVGFTTEMADQLFSLKILLVVQHDRHVLLDQLEVLEALDREEELERRGQQNLLAQCLGQSYPAVHSSSSEQPNHASHGDGYSIAASPPFLNARIERR